MRILLTIPVTVASEEKSFSKLKLIKIYLRSTISQSRLTNLATLLIENEIAENIDFGCLTTDHGVAGSIPGTSTNFKCGLGLERGPPSLVRTIG